MSTKVWIDDVLYLTDDDVADEIERLSCKGKIWERAFHLAIGEMSTLPPYDKSEPDYLRDRILRMAKALEPVSTVPDRLQTKGPTN